MRTLALARDVVYLVRLIAWALLELGRRIGPECCVIALGVAIVAVAI